MSREDTTSANRAKRGRDDFPVRCSKARKLEGGKEKIDWVDGGFGNEGEEKFDVEIDPGVSGSSSSSSSSSSNKNIISSSTSIDHHQQKKQRKR